MKLKLFLFFSLLNLSIASAQTFTVDGVNYSVIPSTTNVRVASNQCYTGALVLPASVTNIGTTYTVTSIGNSAFKLCTGLTSITISNSISSIGDFAFQYCSGLTSIVISNSVFSIGDEAFDYCTGLTSLNIPSSVTSIGIAAFSYCSGLTSINIPNSITSIGIAAFRDCSGLTSINIPSSITLIESQVFNGCSSITSITIPNSITTIGNGAFANCTGLTSINIPDSVTSIGAVAFLYCTNLTSVIIPNSITSIGESAFNNCTGLTSVICAISTPLPLITDAQVFFAVNQSACSLTVPTGSVSAYQAALIWQNFNPIIGSDTLSTTNYSVQDSLQLYPNPVQNELFLELKNSPNAQLNVLDTNGKLLLVQELNTTNNIINTSSLPTGLYLFKITSNEGTITKKIIRN